MPPLKSTTLRLEIDTAGRKHQCHHNKCHEVFKGQTRLKVTEDRSDEHFCRDCAIKMLKADIEKLQELLAKLEDRS